MNVVVVIQWQQGKNGKEANEETEGKSGRVHRGRWKIKTKYEKGTEKVSREPPVVEFGGEVGSYKYEHWPMHWVWRASFGQHNFKKLFMNFNEVHVVNELDFFNEVK